MHGGRLKRGRANNIYSCTLLPVNTAASDNNISATHFMISSAIATGRRPQVSGLRPPRVALPNPKYEPRTHRWRPRVLTAVSGFDPSKWPKRTPRPLYLCVLGRGKPAPRAQPGSCVASILVEIGPDQWKWS